MKPSENPWDYGFKPDYSTTNKIDFTDKLQEVLATAPHKPHFGFQDARVFLESRHIATELIPVKRNIVSTNLTDFVIPGFDIDSLQTPAQLGKAAGRPTPPNPTRFQYGSDDYHTRQVPKLNKKKSLGIFLFGDEQHKRHGIQMFRDTFVEPVAESGLSSQDKALIRKKIQAGLTIPIVDRQRR